MRGVMMAEISKKGRRIKRSGVSVDGKKKAESSQLAETSKITLQQGYRFIFL